MNLLTVEVKGPFCIIEALYLKEDNSFFREVVSPGDDTTGKDQKILDAVAEYHTQDILDAYENR